MMKTSAVKTFQNYFNWKKYTITLCGISGEVIAYAVEVSARGKATTNRKLWSKKSGKPMPQLLKDVLEVKGTPETIARVMGW